MSMCKGRHLEWYEVKIGILLEGLGFSRRIVSSALGVHKESLEQWREKIMNRIIQGDTRDLEELQMVINIILKDENSFITKKFKELLKKCLELEEAKRKMLKEMYRRRCQEI